MTAPRVRTGFTLIEVLIAIALMLAMIGTMYGFLFDMFTTRSRVLEHVWQETAGAVIIKQLESDLMACIVGDQASGGGVVGDDRGIRVLTRGVAASLAARGVDDPDVFGDLQLAEYRFDAPNHRIEGRRSPAGRQPVPSAPFTPLEGVVHHLRFRYFDGEQWGSSFNSLSSNRLPVAVEVALWYHPLPDESAAEPEFAPVHAGNVVDKERQLDPTAASEAEPANHDASPHDVSSPPDRIRIFIIPDARGGESREPTARSDAS